MNRNKVNKLIIIKNPIYCLAFGLGLGFAPIAPGTFGTLLGVLIYFIVYNIFSLDLILYLIFVSFSFVIGVYICGKTASYLKVHDHPGIVWDEVVGYLITMVNIKFNMVNLILGFILFRLFDIAKPWPIRAIDQKVTGGFGIMLDDVLAGVYANIVLTYIVLYLS